MEQGNPELRLDDISGLFERAANSEEQCRRFAMPLVQKLGGSLCTVAIGGRNAARLIYACNADGPVPARAALAAERSRGTLVLPLGDGHGIAGHVTVHGATQPIDAGHLRTLQALARVFSLSLANVALEHEAARLAEASDGDRLTETLNRNAFHERLRTEWRRAARELTPIAVALLDADYFGAYNDEYGQSGGDAALAAIADTIAAAGLRSCDLVARYEGDVFALLLPGSTEEGALALCERIRGAIAGHVMPNAASPLGILTCSAGVASMRPNSRRMPAALLYEAEAALHRAKQAGRNRVAGKDEIRTSLPFRPPSLLPQPVAPFTGSEADARALAAIAEPLVTIAGPSGAGKSALALEVARRAPERAVFVSLAGAGSTGVLERVARALGIVAHSSSQFVAALRDRTLHEALLIVLDGCDDAVEGATAFIETVHGIEGVRTLVTSRAPLRLRGERVHSIAGAR